MKNFDLVDSHSRVTKDGPSRGAAQHVEERKGFRLVCRGAVGRMVEHDYECPVHGVFTVSVPSDAVPDAVECRDTATPLGLTVLMPCGHPALWCAPRVTQGFAAGEVKS